jgi:hypothetical protein
MKENMSFPNIPNVTPSSDINRDDVINLLLASIAFEELGLAHIINAEAKKIQAVVDTLPGITLPGTTIADLLSINDSVDDVLKTAIKNEMLLQFKLENILDLLDCQISVIARQVIGGIPGASIERFFGTVQGESQVTVEVVVNGVLQVPSQTVNVDANGNFQVVLNVPVIGPDFQLQFVFVLETVY